MGEAEGSASGRGEKGAAHGVKKGKFSAKYGVCGPIRGCFAPASSSAPFFAALPVGSWPSFESTPGGTHMASCHRPRQPIGAAADHMGTLVLAAGSHEKGHHSADQLPCGNGGEWPKASWYLSGELRPARRRRGKHARSGTGRAPNPSMQLHIGPDSGRKRVCKQISDMKYLGGI